MHNGTVSVLVRHLESYTLTNGIQKTKEHLEGDVYPFEIFIETIRNSPPDVFLRKVVLKICSKVTEKHPCRGVICNFIEITLRHGSSPVNFLHIFRTHFLKDTSGGLLLKSCKNYFL